ncbi:helix-turn-helix domain-containing protein [Pseudomonas citronellolis]|uniref:helix-turn-helix domain-containing protein n=1 Tax=Pseudomonas citronellolis TaxID=53408 RepID=UPI0009F65559|nr:helix-turn-helix transcriptional regulator [Pseudomonas humi]
MAGTTAQRLGKKIKALRQAKGLTQVELAEAAGYDPITISRFERGEYAPGLDALETLGQVFDASVADFFASESDEESVARLRHSLCDEVYGTSDPATLKSMLKAVRKVKGK